MRYYDYPYYWTGPAADEGETPGAEQESRAPPSVPGREIGYYVPDDDVGHVEDFLAVDDGTWAICYIVVATRNWLPGRKVVISPGWITTVSWNDSRVYVDLRRKEVEAAPEYDPNMPLERGHETRLYEHYRRAKYWDEERERR